MEWKEWSPCVCVRAWADTYVDVRWFVVWGDWMTAERLVNGTG
jgi:hypothetical protein